MYIGVTNNLKRRVNEHKNGEIDSFTKKYNFHKLVYFEPFMKIEEAIKKEKQLKKWKRQWKNELVETVNPEWKDLFNDI